MAIKLSSENSLELKRIERILRELELRAKNVVLRDIPVKYSETDYKVNNILPAVDEKWTAYCSGMQFGGYDKHSWLYTSFKTPSCLDDEQLKFTLNVENKTGVWDGNNPQCILYVNGELVQGLDYWHHEYDLEKNTQYEIYVYNYTGTEKAW